MPLLPAEQIHGKPHFASVTAGAQKGNPRSGGSSDSLPFEVGHVRCLRHMESRLAASALVRQGVQVHRTGRWWRKGRKVPWSKWIVPVSPLAPPVMATMYGGPWPATYSTPPSGPLSLSGMTGTPRRVVGGSFVTVPDGCRLETNFEMSRRLTKSLKSWLEAVVFSHLSERRLATAAFPFNTLDRWPRRPSRYISWASRTVSNVAPLTLTVPRPGHAPGQRRWSGRGSAGRAASADMNGRGPAGGPLRVGQDLICGLGGFAVVGCRRGSSTGTGRGRPRGRRRLTGGATRLRAAAARREDQPHGYYHSTSTDDPPFLPHGPIVPCEDVSKAGGWFF